MPAPHRHLTIYASAGPLPSRSLVAVSRKPLRLSIEPFRQGDLDGLCGLYAIINALRLLHPEMDEDASRALFRKLTKTLGRTLSNPIKPVHAGIDQTTLEDLLITARCEFERHLGIALEIEPLRLWRKRPTLADLWEAFRDKLDSQQVAIIGLSGVKEHWSVACAASESTIPLFDSADRHKLRRSRCTLQPASTRFRLRPKAVILVKRVR